MVGGLYQLNGHELEQALSRDITLPTKVRLVKATVFPVVTYGCESWTVKKAECMTELNYRLPNYQITK